MHRIRATLKRSLGVPAQNTPKRQEAPLEGGTNPSKALDGGLPFGASLCFRVLSYRIYNTDMTNAFRFLAALALMVCGSGVLVAGPGSMPAQVDITILHVNDVHGQISGSGSVRGYARLATAVEQVRAQSKAAGVLLLHGGDELSRGDALTRGTLGAANIQILNHLRFDAWTPGNGDFYDGTDNLNALIRRASFPTLCANVKVAATGKCLGKEYILKQVGPARVAIFGLCYVRMPKVLNPTLEVADATETARKLVPELRKQADLVVLLSHLGIDDDVKLAGAVDGIDVIVGAHSHTCLPAGKRVAGHDGKEVLIAQADEHLNYLGQVELTMERQGQGYRLKCSTAKLLPLDAAVPQDPAVKAVIARLAEKASTQPATRLERPEHIK